MEWIAPDEWLVVFERDSAQSRISANEEPAIDAAVSQYLESGKDSLLHVSFVEGFEYVILASQITSWFLSTPEFRARGVLVDGKVKQEKRATGWVDDG